MKIIRYVYRALDKREYFDDIFSYFSSKPYVVTPHLNRLFKTVQMRGHNIGFYEELTKIIPDYPQILPLIQRSGVDIIITPDIGILHCQGKQLLTFSVLPSFSMGSSTSS